MFLRRRLLVPLRPQHRSETGEREPPLPPIRRLLPAVAAVAAAGTSPLRAGELHPLQARRLQARPLQLAAATIVGAEDHATRLPGIGCRLVVMTPRM